MRRLSSLLAAAALLALSAQVVSADALVADGDGLAPIAGARLDVGTICHAETTTAVALVAVRATGHPNNRQVFDNNATVTMSATVLSGAGLAAASAAPTTVMAPDWRSQPNQALAPAVSWDVSVTPDTLGRYRGRLEFRAEGLNRHGQTISRVARMNIVGRVVDCTPPVFADVPPDVTFEADAADGADVTYVPPTATDAIDGAVAVACDLPPSTRLPIGLTTVSCAAADAVGNATTVTFDVTVADTTAPVLDGTPADVAMTAADADGAVVDWVVPSSADVVDGLIPVVCDPAPGSLFPIGSTTVSCSATDAAGNVATAAFVVAVAAPPAPEPIPDEPVEPDEPVVEEEPAPQQPVLEDTEAGGPTVEPPPVAVVAPAPPTPTVLPDTSLTAAGTAGVSIGFLMVAGAAVAAASRRRPS